MLLRRLLFLCFRLLHKLDQSFSINEVPNDQRRYQIQAENQTDECPHEPAGIDDFHIDPRMVQIHDDRSFACECCLL